MDNWSGFLHTKISDSYFCRAIFKNICFHATQIHRTFMDEISANKLTFYWCILEDISFCRSNLQYFKIADSEKECKGLNFERSNLVKCCFVNSSYSKNDIFIMELDFTHTKISNVVFYNVYLKNCEYRNLLNFFNVFFYKVKFDEKEMLNLFLKNGAWINGRKDMASHYYSYYKPYKTMASLLEECDAKHVVIDYVSEDIDTPFFVFW